MTKQIISLSENAAKRIKEIMSVAEKNSVGVRVGVKSGGCAGMWDWGGRGEAWAVARALSGSVRYV